MIDRLRLLRAKDAERVMGEAMVSKADGGPLSVQGGEPEEKFNTKRCPVSPNKTPMCGCCAAREEGLVA